MKKGIFWGMLMELFYIIFLNVFDISTQLMKQNWIISEIQYNFIWTMAYNFFWTNNSRKVRRTLQGIKHLLIAFNKDINTHLNPPMQQPQARSRKQRLRRWHQTLNFFKLELVSVVRDDVGWCCPLQKRWLEVVWYIKSPPYIRIKVFCQQGCPSVDDSPLISIENQSGDVFISWCDDEDLVLEQVFIHLQDPWQR